MNYRVGIDIGGTFTDFALLKGSEVILHKNLSTPEDRSVGVMEGLGKLAEKEGHSLGDFLGKCDAIVHGTTIADNTLIEMNGAITGLITTEGFRDEIELRRGFKEDIWDVRLAPPIQITPRRRRLTVPERILHDGSVYQELDEAAVRQACEERGLIVRPLVNMCVFSPPLVITTDEIDAMFDILDTAIGDVSADLRRLAG